MIKFQFRQYVFNLLDFKLNYSKLLHTPTHTHTHTHTHTCTYIHIYIEREREREGERERQREQYANGFQNESCIKCTQIP